MRFDSRVSQTIGWLIGNIYGRAVCVLKGHQWVNINYEGSLDLCCWRCPKRKAVEKELG